jgi:hypothetical protein
MVKDNWVNERRAEGTDASGAAEGRSVKPPMERKKLRLGLLLVRVHSHCASFPRSVTCEPPLRYARVCKCIPARLLRSTVRPARLPGTTSQHPTPCPASHLASARKGGNAAASPASRSATFKEEERERERERESPELASFQLNYRNYRGSSGASYQ